MMKKKLCCYLIFLFALLLPALSAQAYDAPRIYVKEINLSQTSFKGGDTIAGDFLMWNSNDGIATDIDYKIYLLKDRQKFGEKSFPVSGQIYPDGTYKQNFSYAAPENIASGSYVLFIRLYTRTGTPLNWGQKDITISGNDNLLQISGSKLMQGDSEFAPMLGVNFDPNEKPPLAAFSASNPSAKSIEYDLKVTVYNVQSSMEELESFSAEKGVIDSAKSKYFSITLPKYGDGGTYLAKIGFHEKNILVSSEESFRWVIKGPSARILKVESGEDFFQKDKIAKITVDFVGPADGSSLEGANLTVSVFSKDGKVMASLNRDIRLGSSVGSEVFDFIPSADVLSPRIEAKIVKDGKTLNSYTVAIKTAGDTDESVAPIQSAKDNSVRNKIFASALVLIVLLALIAIIKFTKGKKTFMFLALAIFLTADLAVFVGSRLSAPFFADADLDDMTVTIQSPVADSQYDFGDSINFSGDANISMCVNGVSYLDAQAEICDKDQANCVPMGNFLSNIPKGLVRINESGTDYVYVLDAGGRVMKYKESDFGPAGTIPAPVAVLGGFGSGNGQFKDPESISYDSVSGYIYVADNGNNRIVRFKPGDANSPINNWKANWQVIGADRVTKIHLNWIESPAGSGNWIQQQGSYYSPTMPPIVTFSGGGGSGAAAMAVVGASGKVTAINITNVGSGYSSAPTVSIQKPGIRAINTSTPASGGSGCTAATVVISDGGGTGATATATTSATGALTFTIIERGRNYTAGPITITPMYTCTTNPTISGVYTITTGTTAGAYSTLGVTSPISVFYDSASSYLYAAERGANNRVVRFKPSDISNTWQAFGNGWAVGKGYFRSVGAVFYDSSSELSGPGSGYIYVAGGWSSQIIRFKAANMIGTWQKIGADSLTNIRVDNGGSGYIAVPNVVISGGGAVVNATATAILGTGADSDKVVSIKVDTGGMGYTSEPAVAISGGGGAGATATTWFSESFAGSGVGQFGNAKGVYYDSSTDYIYVSGGDSVVKVKASSNMISGSRLVSDPVIDWTDLGTFGTGTGKFNLVRGAFYDSATENIYTADEGNYRVVRLKLAEEFATATAIISGGAVTGINITDKGKGYTAIPVVTISGGGGSGATAVVDSIVGNKVQSIAITNGGSGYTSAPTITISKIGEWSEIDFTPPTSDPDLFPFSIDTNIPASFAAPFTLGASGEAFAKVTIKATDGAGNFYETASFVPIFIRSNNAPVVIADSVVLPDYCIDGPEEIKFQWSFNDVEDGNGNQTAYQINLTRDGGGPGNTCSVNGTADLFIKAATINLPANCPNFVDYGHINYAWSVTVWDSGGLSDTEVYAGLQFDTPNHQYPIADFNYIPLTPVPQFQDIDFDPGPSQTFGGSSIVQWTWDFGDGTAFRVIVPPLTGDTTYSYAEPDRYTVDLEITDSDGNSCWASDSGNAEDIDVELSKPTWNEVEPESYNAD